MKPDIKIKVFFGLLITLSIFIFVSLYTYYRLDEFTQVADWRKHSFAVLSNIDNLQEHLEEMQGFHRGFVITGDKAFLESYYHSQELAHEKLTALKYLLSNDKYYQHHLNELEAVLSQKEEFTGRIIKVRQTIGEEVAEKLVETHTGEKLMEEIRGITDDLQTKENDLLEKYDSSLKRQAKSNIYIIFIGGVVSLIAVIILFIIIIRELKLREQIEKSLEEARDNLEDRVIERTRELKASQQEAQQGKEKFQNLVENINEVIYSINKEATITYMSPYIQKVSEHTSEEVIGKPFAEFICKDDLPAVMNHFEAALSGNSLEIDFRIIKKSGELCWVYCSVRPIGSNHDIIGIQGVFRDVNEMKNAEAEIQKRMKDLEDFYAMAVTRELRMKDLKGEISELKGRLGKYEKLDD